MKNKNIIIAGLIVALFAVTVCAEYVYLKRTFADNSAQVVEEVKEEPVNDAGMDKKIKSLKAKATVAMAVANSKDKKISELQQKLLMTVNYYEDKLHTGAEDAAFNKSELNSDAFALSGTASFSHSSRKQLASRLDAFVNQMAGLMDEDSANAFKEKFGALIESLNADESDIPLEERKQETLASLQAQLEGTKDGRMKKRIQKRIDAIAGADEADLTQILSYYQRLDDIKQVGNLMQEFNISRSELRQAGIEPPPRTNWGADVLEIGDNLISFTDLYKPMIAPEKQERFQKEIYDYVDEITRWRTDKEAEKQRDTWRTGMMHQMESADAGKKAWLTDRLRKLEAASLEDIKTYTRYTKLGDLHGLASDYDIPLDDLIKNGAMIKTW